MEDLMREKGYPGLVEKCRRDGRQVRCEHRGGCRGFIVQSCFRTFSKLGITGASKHKVIKLVTEVSEVVSRWLWIQWGERWVTLDHPHLGEGI